MVEVEHIKPPQPVLPVRRRKKQKPSLEKPENRDTGEEPDEDKPLIDEYA